jgi:hypothetical protein|tara:strand:- start:1285 stop:1413 length:129 start_codon:yes stop_codon:yes gene_type:complete
MSKTNEKWMEDLLDKYTIPNKEVVKPTILTEQQIKIIKDGKN